MVSIVVYINLFCYFPLSPFILCVARTGLFRVIRVLKDCLIVFRVLVKVEILFKVLKLNKEKFTL